MTELDAIKARHLAWYNGDDKEAEWSDDLDFVETYQQQRDWTPRTAAMAHEIARNDVPRLVYALEAALKLAEEWRYKGEFGWGAWQEGEGPDPEGYALDGASADLRTAILDALEDKP